MEKLEDCDQRVGKKIKLDSNEGVPRKSVNCLMAFRWKGKKKILYIFHMVHAQHVSSRLMNGSQGSPNGHCIETLVPWRNFCAVSDLASSVLSVATEPL